MSTISPPVSDGTIETDVIAALRLAVEGTEDYDQLGRIVGPILDCAPETPDKNTGGVRLLLDLHREGKLKFDLTEG